MSLGLSTLADSDLGQEFGDCNYVEAAYEFPLPNEASLGLHAGYYRIKNSTNNKDFSVSLDWKGFSFMVSTLKGDESLEDDLISLSYSRSFEF